MQWRKKGQALCVIVMAVGKEERPSSRLACLLAFGFEFGTQPHNAGSRIYDDQVRADADLETGRITAKLGGPAPRNGISTAHTPKGCRKPNGLGHQLVDTFYGSLARSTRVGHACSVTKGQQA
jgi:hypothetical protein